MSFRHFFGLNFEDEGAIGSLVDVKVTGARFFPPYVLRFARYCYFTYYVTRILSISKVKNLSLPGPAHDDRGFSQEMV